MKNTLKDKKVINNIFAAGKTKSDGIVLIKSIESEKSEILVTVSSKKFPRAVDRNKIKRLLRESTKGLDVKNRSLAIVYVGNELPNFETIRKSVSKLI